MITLLLVISVVLLGVSVMISDDYGNDIWKFLAMIFSFTSVILFIIFICCIFELSEKHSTSQKIEMYQEENIKIESQISELVSQYMEYEKETFKGTKTESSITLVSLYPELKSDKLVDKQLNIYYKNSNKIKALKSKKLEYSTYKYLLCFRY